MEMINVLKKLSELAKENSSEDIQRAIENTKKMSTLAETIRIVEEHMSEGVEDRIAAAKDKARASGKKVNDEKSKDDSNTKQVKGTRYGGSKQKDDKKEDDDLDESLQGIAEASTINGKTQSDDEMVWKQTSLSQAAAVEKYGKANVKIDGKSRQGKPIVLVNRKLVEAEKPDFLDLDKDGNKKEPMRKAAKDAKKLSEKAKNPYAVGMAQAMKSTGDKPPLKKSTITKAHDIAKKVKMSEADAAVAPDKQRQIDAEVEKATAGVTDPAKVKAAAEAAAAKARAKLGVGVAAADGKPTLSVTAEAIKEDVNLNISANGEQDVIGLVRKLAGIPSLAISTPSSSPAPAQAQAQSPCMHSMINKMNDIESDNMDEADDSDYANSPDEQISDVNAVIASGDDLHKTKSSYPKVAGGDNPMAKDLEENLWKQYTEK
jgi:hypothetical protein